MAECRPLVLTRAFLLRCVTRLGCWIDNDSVAIEAIKCARDPRGIDRPPNLPGTSFRFQILNTRQMGANHYTA